MEKEKVLEIESQEVFDKIAVRIKYQNFEVLKRGNFRDEETGVESCWAPEYVKYDNKLYIQGKEKNKDNIVLLVDKEDFKKILEKVNEINEKYGIPKRWRAEKGEKYFLVTTSGLIEFRIEVNNAYDELKYNLGNYFKTKEQAKKVLDSKEWQDLWAKVRAGEIGGDE